MDPLNPPVSIVLALWAPSPSSHGLSLVEGPDGAHDVIGSVVTGGSDTPTAADDVMLPPTTIQDASAWNGGSPPPAP